jgi:hypothetical protein
MHAELFFNYGDKAGEANFISWHQMRHRTYDLIASTQGKSLPMLDLTGRITDDWMHRHSVRHRTHRKLMGVTSTSHLAGLATVRWHDRRQQQDWLFHHALEHQALDRFYKVP